VHHEFGLLKASKHLGLHKTAVAPSPSPAPGTTAPEPADTPTAWSTKDKLQAGLAGTAAVAPFAGMVGQAPLKHDPYYGGGGQRVKSFQEMQRMAQPGDVVLTTKPGGSIWKHFISPIAGSEFYHAQPIVGRRNGQGLSGSAGVYADPDFAKDTPKQLRDQTPTLSKAMKEDHYAGGVLMRPRDVSSAEKNLIADKSLTRLKRDYDASATPGLWLKELFMPKVPGVTDKGPQTVCEGNVCSTLPAMATHEATQGRVQVVPGKAAKDVFPTDFLRSSAYEPVAAHIPQQMAELSPEWMKARKLLSRGALGAGLAGATYAATEDPAYAAAPVGGALAYKGVQGALKNWHPRVAGKSPAAAQEAMGKVFPTVFEGLEGIADKTLENRGNILKHFGTRTLPAIAGGSLAAYLGARGLENLYADKNSTGT
jgi:hypothetical protein